MRIRIEVAIVALALISAACRQEAPKPRAEATASGATIERLDPALDAIVAADARVEKIAGGFHFTEGPVWVPDSGYLLFTDNDIPVVKKWTPTDSVTDLLGPEQLTPPQPSIGSKPGADGSSLDPTGRPIISDVAHRSIARINEQGRLTTVVDRYQGKRLNSPNDMIYRSDGALYFTDPTYGLEQDEADPHRDLDFAGVYRLVNGRVELLTRELRRPNGVAFSPDEKFLYVGNSEETRKIWMRYPVRADGSLDAGTVFYDATASTEPGLPDGFKVDIAGNLFASGPGGLWILSPTGKPLGRIRMPEVTANCHWGDADAKTLYLTASTGLYRIRLLTTGIRPRGRSVGK